MEKRKLSNALFVGTVALLALGALLMVLIPLGRLLVDAITALLRSWGVLPGIGAVLGHTLQLVAMVVLLVLPLGFLIALWMFEYVKGRALLRVQRFMNGFSRCPAVLFGLVGNWLLGSYTPLHNSLWSMALLLSVMFLPFMVSRIDAALRAVPQQFLHAGEALGGQPLAVFRLIILPEALPKIIRATLRLMERVLCEATALLVLLGAVIPNQVLATELFRLSWLGRKDAAVLAFGLAAVMIMIRLITARRWRNEEEENHCRHNWW